MVTKISRNCPGDCSKCELLSSGEISDMVPCILDQIFQRTQENRKLYIETMRRLEVVEAKINSSFNIPPITMATYKSSESSDKEDINLTDE